MKHPSRAFSLCMNHILVILYLCRLSRSGAPLSPETAVPLVFATFIMTDITYISACNIRENKVISLFCALLALDCWYLLLLPDTGTLSQLAFRALSPVIWYASIQFILMFLFQDCGYRFQKPVNAVLLATCTAAIAGLGLSGQCYALLYGIQFVTSWCCFLSVILYHRQRTAFVLKSERKSILFSVAVTVAVFFVYYYATIELPNHISNFGIYIPTLLFCISVHRIVLREHQRYPLSAVFRPKQVMFTLTLSVIAIVLIVLTARGTLYELCIAIHSLFCLIHLCNILAGCNFQNDETTLVRPNEYLAVLQQLQKEEALKTDFANFLHDEILQDILSVKNMLAKAHRPEIQALLTETLDNLGATIREQMQDYHPVILKNLTIKENYQNLLDAVACSFPERQIAVSFDCSDTLFLVDPYQILIYRFLKELLTNIYKHSDANQAWVTLLLDNDRIQLCVIDNGTAHAANLPVLNTMKLKTPRASGQENSSGNTPHGISLIAEQIADLDGTIEIYDISPHGIRIQIQVPMKGDRSYEYFVSR